MTGGAGFIGSNVVDGLIDNGHDVVVLDNLSTGFHTNINSNVTFYDVDIRDEDKVRQIFELEKPDFINHQIERTGHLGGLRADTQLNERLEKSHQPVKDSHPPSSPISSL